MSVQTARWDVNNVLKEAGRTILAIVTIAVLLIVVGWTTSQVKLVENEIHKFSGLFLDDKSQLVESIAPSWIVATERTAPTIAYLTWVGMAIAVVYLGFLAPRTLKSKLVESTRKLDIILGLVAGGALAGLTGYLWAVWNPVPILPPFIHLRIFSFLVGVWGILVGRATGFLTGYFGGIVWGLISGYFLLPHTPVNDGVFVGLMTGWFISVVCRQGLSREELLAKIDENRWSYYARCSVAGLIGGIVMAFFVAVSMKVTSPLSWWASFWAIGVLSDTLPMVIWIGPVSEAALRLTRRLTWLPNF